MKHFILISILAIKITTGSEYKENNLPKRITAPPDKDNAENCFEILDKQLITNTAGSLLLYQARGVYNLLKDNPFERNRELLSHILANKNLKHEQIAKLFKIDDDADISDELFLQDNRDSEKDSQDNRKDNIEKFLETYPLIGDRLDELSLLLSDFLSLDNKGFEQDVDGQDTLFEIKRMLYGNVEEIPDNFTLTHKDFAVVELKDLKCKDNGIIDGDTKNLQTKISNTTQRDADVRLWETPTGEDRNFTTKPSIERDSLYFYEIPQGDVIGIYKMDPENEFILFSVFSEMVSFLQPEEFPLGLLKHALQKKMPMHFLILQVIKLEGLVLCWVLFWGILALCLPFAVIAQTCCSGKNLRRLRDDTSSASSTLNNSCSHRAVGFLLYILILGLLCSILLMLAANDKFSRALEKLPATSKLVLKDAATFVKNTQLQLNYITTNSFELTMKEITKDMKDVDKLLGKPFQEELSSRTGIDRTIQELKLLKSSSADVSRRAKDVMRECNDTQAAGKALQEALQEVSKQLNLAKRYCPETDRTLCESLQATGLTLAINFVKVAENPTLRYLEQINYDDKFNASVDETAKLYENIPTYVGDETRFRQAGIDEVLERHRRQIYASVRSLDEVTRSITTLLRENSGDILAVVEKAAARDLWRYLAVLASSLLLFIIWASLVCGSPCGCHYITKSVPFLKIGIVLICFSSLLLWILASVCLIFGGHGRTIICNPLYQDHFTVLSSILDENGVLYEEGFLKYILKSNQTMKIEDVLRSCEKDQTVYTTFHFENRIDISKILNYQSWADLRDILDSFTINTQEIKLKSNDLDQILLSYGSTSTQKIHELRTELSMPITFKDLNTFLDQMYEVTRQISSTRSATSFEKVWLRLQDMINDEYKIVRNHRDSLLFKLTSLQILLQPGQERTDRLLSKIAEAEQYLHSNGTQIAEKSIKRFMFRFERNLNELQRHINEQLRKKVGKCKPVWDLFDFTRRYLCQSMVDPLNCLACSYFIIIAILMGLTPLIINLIQYYRNADISIETSAHMSYEGSLDHQVWNTPPVRALSNGISNGNHDGLIESGEETVWIGSPRHPTALPIPSPPMLPSVVMSPSPRFTSPNISGTNARQIKSLVKLTEKSPRFRI